MSDLQRLIEAVERDDEDAARSVCRSMSSSAVDKGLYWPGQDVMRAYSGSLDAAKRLHVDFLSGWMLPCMVSHYLNGKHGVTVELYERDGSGEAIATHDDMARSWLLAILRALAAQSDISPDTSSNTLDAGAR